MALLLMPETRLAFLGVVLTVNPHLSRLWRLSFQRFKWLEEAETFSPQEA